MKVWGFGASELGLRLFRVFRVYTYVYRYVRMYMYMYVEGSEG